MKMNNKLQLHCKTKHPIILIISVNLHHHALCRARTPERHILTLSNATLIKVKMAANYV